MGTGSIKLHEFRQVLLERFDIDDEHARTIFSALDSTCNEEIHYSEFLAAMMSSRIQVHEDLVIGAFHRFDKGNSGFITLENLRQVLGESLDGAEVESLVQEADVMSDGRISYEDFIEYICGDNAREAHQEVAGKIIEHELTMHNVKCRPATPKMLSPKSRGAAGGRGELLAMFEELPAAKEPLGQELAVTKTKVCTI